MPPMHDECVIACIYIYIYIYIVLCITELNFPVQSYMWRICVGQSTGPFLWNVYLEHAIACTV